MPSPVVMWHVFMEFYHFKSSCYCADHFLSYLKNSYFNFCFYFWRVSEAWVGVKYTDGKWVWENGMDATEQRYFRDLPFNNVTSPVCGKAVLEQKTQKIRKLYIRQEDCSTKLPIICQFSKLAAKSPLLERIFHHYLFRWRPSLIKIINLIAILTNGILFTQFTQQLAFLLNRKRVKICSFYMTWKNQSRAINC